LRHIAIDDPLSLNAHELKRAFLDRVLLPSEVIGETIARIHQLNPRLNAFTTVAAERAEAEARAADKSYAKGGHPRALEGIPLAVKDLFDTAGIRTTYGSNIYGAHIPNEDATAVSRARAAGAIVVGKAATHEFGWGITTNNPHFGATRNPWNLDRIPGGSSGGAAAALAARLVPLAIGTDTGGSIRIPAAFCAVVGLKPTWGRISLDGAMPLARSLDHAGPMARTPLDLSLLYRVLVGADAASPATGNVALDFSEQERPLAGLTLGVTTEAPQARLTTSVAGALESIVEFAAAGGAKVKWVCMPDPSDALATFQTIQRAEALHVHRVSGRYPRLAAEYGLDVRGRLEIAEHVSRDDYLRARSQRQRVRTAVMRSLQDVDALLTPVSAIVAPLIGRDFVEHFGELRDVRELVMSYTVVQNLTGLPACTVPAGFDEVGMPIGVQITAAPRRDALVLAVAGFLSSASSDGEHVPQLVSAMRS
jgi:aspartyl-tRNA(Asn)/glutamyl-tRNA(Gln) amidotransferase subunit A